MSATDQISTRGTVGASVTHAANADLVAIMRAGRKLNRLLGGHTSPPAAAAIGQGSATTLPEPPHSGQTDWNVPAPNRKDRSTSI